MTTVIESVRAVNVQSHQMIRRYRWRLWRRIAHQHADKYQTTPSKTQAESGVKLNVLKKRCRLISTGIERDVIDISAKVTTEYDY